MLGTSRPFTSESPIITFSIEEELAGVVDVAEGDGTGGVVQIAACERELLGVVGRFLGIQQLC